MYKLKRFLILTVSGTIIVQSVYGGSLRVTANPCPRSEAVMITDSINNRIILFGGDNRTMPGGQAFNDVWALSLEYETWKPISIPGQSPMPRNMPAIGYDKNNCRMVIFGGFHLGTFLNDTWILNLTVGSESWSEATPGGTIPSPRSNAKGIIDPVNNRFIIFGGDNGSVCFNEVWSLSFDNWTWNQLFPTGTAPQARTAHSAIYDPNGHRIIIFGGRNYSNSFNDVWALDLTAGSESWHQLYPSGIPPAHRSGHFCAYDAQKNEMVVGFGWDVSFLYYNDIWALNLNSLTWWQISTQSVEGRRDACASYNYLSDEVIIFGGNQYGGYYFGDTYSLATDTLNIDEDKSIKIAPYIKILSNPSRLPCKINVFVPTSGDISISIFDEMGRSVNTLIKNKRNTGNYILEWNGNDNNGKKVGAGKYFITLKLDGKLVTRKLVVIK